MDRLLGEFSQFADEYVRKMEEEIAGYELPEEAQIDVEESMKRFYAKIEAAGSASGSL